MDITFDEAAKDYINYQKIKAKPQSLRSITSRLTNYILPYFGDLKITDLTCKKYLEWQLEIERKDFSYKYKKALHYTVVALINYCITFYDLNIENVASKVKNFKNNKNEKAKSDFWTYKEFLKFIKVVNEFIYKLLYKFLFFSGCREGEALALRFIDVKNNYKYIHIEHTITKECIDGERQLTTPKTPSSIRDIRLTRVLRKIIKKLKKYYIKQYGYFDENWFIFGGKKPLSPTTIGRKKDEYCELAKVKRIRIHDFRHSLATLLFSRGVPLTVIARLLGHADYVTTLTVYIHEVPSDQRRVAHLLDFLDFFLFRFIFALF